MINKNQFRFVRNRSGASATRTIEIIQRAQLRTNKNYSIIILDNKKAFDVVELTSTIERGLDKISEWFMTNK